MNLFVDIKFRAICFLLLCLLMTSSSSCFCQGKTFYLDAENRVVVKGTIDSILHKDRKYFLLKIKVQQIIPNNYYDYVEPFIKEDSILYFLCENKHYPEINLKMPNFFIPTYYHSQKIIKVARILPCNKALEFKYIDSIDYYVAGRMLVYNVKSKPTALFRLLKILGFNPNKLPISKNLKYKEITKSYYDKFVKD